MPKMIDPSTGKPHLMCPVHSYTNYTGNLNELNNYLWQAVNDAAYEKGTPNWFKNQPLGENRIATFMSDLSKKAGLSRVYTNHCIRVTRATNLSQ